MTREIKFRGKRTNNGEWVFGDYSRYSEEKSIIMVDLLEQEDYWVPSETVGQYTGLKDKNGVEIYEGDVCKLIFNIVVVDFTSGSFKFRRIDKEDVFFPVCDFTINQCFPEIIGNIHDNPEMLRVRE